MKPLNVNELTKIVGGDIPTRALINMPVVALEHLPDQAIGNGGGGGQ